MYEQIQSDPRVSFMDEPVGLNAAFRVLSANIEISPKRWSDDYLAAFVKVSGLTLITFDKALAARVQGSLLLTP